MLLQSRRGSLVQDRFPDLVAAAAEQLPDGLIVDGELVVWDAGAGPLSFVALQRRAAARSRAAPTLAATLPAFFIAFDILQQDGTERLNLALDLASAITVGAYAPVSVVRCVSRPHPSE
ncbi:ATP-dependent DNA ligase [Streptomyces sp. CB00455]|uniref:ATP-dependent DNA ligase n=1 Tax=Streptomyces sp. CB00455 TaxID=1703927 RepID=UPI001F5B79BA|nr:hypothetical protein [Streptomyces sp. CB00455]